MKTALVKKFRRYNLVVDAWQVLANALLKCVIEFQCFLANVTSPIMLNCPSKILWQRSFHVGPLELGSLLFSLKSYFEYNRIKTWVLGHGRASPVR